jgi:hypothetical protein
MNNDLVAFLNARLDEEADLARRLDGAGCCGEWTASGTATHNRGRLRTAAAGERHGERSSSQPP